MIKNNLKSNDKYTLSQCWGTSQRMTSQRLSFFGKGITYIDRLDMHESILNSLKEIDLSHNALVKVQNMRQFPNLEIVNLAHNHIADGKQIVKLSKLNKIKTVLVKGNPFLKSGEGKIQAMKYLMSVNTDIDILTNKLQLMLCQCIKNYCRNQLKKSYISHIEMQVQLITDFNIKIAQNSTGQVYDRIINTFIQERAQQVEKTCRSCVIKNVIKLADMELSGLQSKQQLQAWFQKCLQEYIQRLQAESMDEDKRLSDKLQILTHVKTIRKQKFNKDNFMTNFKKPTKPLISKHPNSQNIRPFELEPKRNPYELPSIYETNQFTEELPRKSLTKDNGPRGKNLEQKFQTYYSNLLSKYSSVYQLLYSPLHSLKNKQKDLLIETLSNHLREKSFAVFKNQKIKQQLGEMSKKLSQKQKALKFSEQKVAEYKMGLHEKIRSIEQMENQIDQLSQKLEQVNNISQQMRKRVLYLQQQLGQSKLIGIKNTCQFNKIKQQEQNFQKICVLRQKRIIKQSLNCIIARASALNKLKITQKLKKQKQNRLMLRECFDFINKQRFNTKNKKNVMLCLNGLRLKAYLKSFCQQMKLQLQTKKVYKKQNQKAIKIFLKLAQQNRIEKKQQQQKINQNLARNGKKLLTSYWNQWKKYTEQSKQLFRCNEADKYYEENLKTKVFKNWIVFVKLPIHIQAQLTVDLKTKKIHDFLSDLSQNFVDKQLQRQKFINLIVYLNKTSRIHNFIKLKNNITHIRQIRNEKSIRLTNKLRKKYFQEYIRVTFIGRQKRIEEKYKQNLVLLLRKKNIIGKINSQQHFKQIRVNKLSCLIDKYRKYDMSRSLKESLKQFMIEDKRKKTDIKNFYSRLQSYCHNKLKIKNKIIQLKYVLNTNSNKLNDNFKEKRLFVSRLIKPMEQKNKLREFLNKKYYKLMIKCFKQWKIQVLRGEIVYLKNKIQDFGPQIEEISKRQKTTFQEKVVLMNIIDSKQKTIKGYIKQLQQAQYAIKTKEDKYQKLKQFIHQTGDDVTVVGSKVHPAFLVDSRIPERDFDTFLQEEKKEFFSTFRRF